MNLIVIWRLRVYDRGEHSKEVDKSADSDGDEGKRGRDLDSLSHDWHVPPTPR
jgi:hypothetical protein